MAGSMPGGKRAARRLGIRTLRANIDTILREARQGQSFVVTAYGEVLAEIHPPSVPSGAAREPGMLRRRIDMAADFDAMPHEILVAIETGPT